MEGGTRPFVALDSSAATIGAFPRCSLTRGVGVAGISAPRRASGPEELGRSGLSSS
jgi:hypothetical protein